MKTRFKDNKVDMRERRNKERSGLKSYYWIQAKTIYT